MSVSPPLVVLGPEAHPRRRRIAAAFAPAPALRGAVVHAFAGWEGLDRLVLDLTLGGAAAVVLTPLFPARRLPWWGRRFHRILLPSQRLARSWSTFVPLGRLVVVEPAALPDPALGPVYRATEADADDPERILAAAAAGVPVESSLRHALLPPGVGAEARAWATRGRSPADELDALRAVYVEMQAMARRR